LLSLIGYAIFDRRWKKFWVNLGFAIPVYVFLWQVVGSNIDRVLIVVIAIITLIVSFVLGWLRLSDKNWSLTAPVVLHTMANGFTYSIVMLIG